MKEVFPVCAKSTNPERILMAKDHSPRESTLEMKAFVKSIDARGFDRNNTIEEIRHGVIRRVRKTD
jgi:hypothetical protein